MRFFLDHDVDANVVTALVKEGHECWTASDAGLSDASDDDLTVYAGKQGACLVTHDREFSVRRSRNVTGHHVWLTCNEWDAASVITSRLPDLLLLLERHPDLMITLKASGNFSVAYGWA